MIGSHKLTFDGKPLGILANYDRIRWGMPKTPFVEKPLEIQRNQHTQMIGWLKVTFDGKPLGILANYDGI